MTARRSRSTDHGAPAVGGFREFSIRGAREADAPVVTRFIRDLGTFKRLETETAEVTAARVTRHLTLCLADDSHTVLLAESPEGDLLGYAAVHWLPYLFLAGPEGYVSELFVHQDRRGGGVGGALLDTVIGEARRRGCARLMLAAVKTRESYLRGFYQQRGWIDREDMANMVYEL